MLSRSTAVVSLVAILVLGAGMFVAWRSRQPAAVSPNVATERTGDSSNTERMIAEALEPDPGPVDSVEIKTGWRDDVPGIDLAAIASDRREVFLRHANSRMCTCGCGFTLAACRTYDPTCPVSLPRVEALFDSASQGFIADARGLRKRLTVRASRD